MKSEDQPEQVESEELPAESSGADWESDDEFENEELGERQAEACSLEEGCSSCQ